MVVVFGIGLDTSNWDCPVYNPARNLRLQGPAPEKPGDDSGFLPDQNMAIRAEYPHAFALGADPDHAGQATPFGVPCPVDSPYGLYHFQCLAAPIVVVKFSTAHAGMAELAGRIAKV